MNQAFGRPRRPSRPSINLASLIDVMFLLLIFFMVSSVFRNSAGIDITLPTATTSAEQEETPHEIFIEGDGSITFGEERGVALDALEGRMRALLEADPEARMALSGDEEADFKDFIAVVDTARRVGGKQLIIRTQMPEPATPGAEIRNP